MDFHRVREALKEGGNVVGLASTVALSAALLTPIPLLVGLVAETAYLLFVPDSKWYGDRLARRNQGSVVQNQHAERQALIGKVLPTLRNEMRERWQRLAETRRQIEAQASGDGAWYGQMLEKLDYLLDKFLIFAGKEQQFITYLGSLPQIAQGVRIPTQRAATYNDWVAQTVSAVQAGYTRDIDSTRRLIAKEADADSKAVLEKRADVLARRSDYVGKMGKTLTNLAYQLQLLEDTFGLINDEIRARSPEQVLSDIDDVVTQTDVMTKTLEEIAPYEQLAAKVGG